MTVAEDGSPTSALLARLGLEPDEVAVASLAARQVGEGDFDLRFGSVLVGPPELAELSWPEWSAAEAAEAPWAQPLLDAAGRPLDQWRQFDEAVDGWRLLRFPVPLAELEAWLVEVVEQGVLRVPDGPSLRASLQPPPAVVRVFPRAGTATSSLAAMACRPLLGWLHRVAADQGEGHARVRTVRRPDGASGVDDPGSWRS